MAEAARTIDFGMARAPAAPLTGGTLHRLSDVIEVAIVGLGAWGLCVLERVLGTARLRVGGGRRTHVHVIEPNRPGSGVYAVDGPDYFLLNTPCGQLSLNAWPDDRARGGPTLGLYEWAVRRGYRWEGDSCRIGSGGRAVSEHDFLPRRIMGEYLKWFFAELVAMAPPNVALTYHRTRVVDVVRERSGRERIHLATGEELTVDDVVLTSGHSGSGGAIGDESGGSTIAPYPVGAYSRRAAPGQSIVIAGMGLVATDVTAALTVGRGGTFSESGTRLRYRPSGREPLIHLYSRGGMPHCAKPMAALDATDQFQPAIFTPDVVSSLRERTWQRRAEAGLDARREILPLVCEEMQLRYYEQAAALHGGREAGQLVRQQWLGARSAGSGNAVAGALAVRFGRFDPMEHLFPAEGRTFEDRADYESFVHASVERDLEQALRDGGSSPVKAAYEVLRFLRDPMRQVIEFGGLRADSHVDFFRNIRGRMTRLVAGPPLQRSQQLLALMDAGIVRLPVGPAPRVAVGDGTESELTSTQLGRPSTLRTSVLIRGFLNDPVVGHPGPDLLSRLCAQGRIQPLRLSGQAVGSVDLSPDFHPINAAGQEERTLWVFGAVTEGVRYFTHYLPSPKSRIRAVVDAQACAEQILG